MVYGKKFFLRPSCKPKQKFGNFRNFVVRVSYFSFLKVDRHVNQTLQNFENFENTSSSPSSSTNPKIFSSTLTSSCIASKSISISSNRFIGHQTIALTWISRFLTHIVALVRSYRKLTILWNSWPIFWKFSENSLEFQKRRIFRVTSFLKIFRKFRFFFWFKRWPYRQLTS